jgi:hypothetical protein
MASRLKVGSPRCGSSKIGIGNSEDLEEAVLVLEKLGRKPVIMRGCSRTGEMEAVLSLPSILAALREMEK